MKSTSSYYCNLDRIEERYRFTNYERIYPLKL